jgi:hypothetical protein
VFHARLTFIGESDKSRVRRSGRATRTQGIRDAGYSVGRDVVIEWPVVPAELRVQV